MSNKTIIAAAAIAVLGAVALAPVTASARIAGPSVSTNNVPSIGIRAQATPPRIKSDLKIKFNCYYSRQRNELGIWVTVRTCG